MPTEPIQPLASTASTTPESVEALEQLAAAMLADTPAAEVDGELADLARALLGAPVAILAPAAQRRPVVRRRPTSPIRETTLDGILELPEPCRRVIATGAPLLLKDALSAAGVIRAFAGVPIRAAGGSVRGCLAVLDDEPRVYSADDLAVLGRLAQIAEAVGRLKEVADSTEAWKEARHTTEGGRAAYDAALVEGLNRRLQLNLLPRIREEEARRRVSVGYRPGTRRMLLGGDFADVAPRPDGTTDVVIGDVCGSGPEAAALAVVVRGAWSALRRRCDDLGELLGELNELVLREQPAPFHFVTVLAGRIDRDGGILEAASAGHPFPLALGDGVDELALEPGYPLGIYANAGWGAQTLALEGRDLLLYTDGLVEGRAKPRRGDRFGVTGLLAAAERLAGTAATGDLPASLIGAATQANGGPLADDVTVVHVAV